ncbi:hypothetical protein SAMN06265376_10120 [Dokdonia pacifica]|uniref:Uncharacterized protein n=1 Tax=Dokdonia pacifica TaxID=1627892 RepID=A0A238VLL8_9FLAO|nr:hypothetical protein SAMN06265376_10120 [Dokdonia pacifica]
MHLDKIDSIVRLHLHSFPQILKDEMKISTIRPLEKGKNGRNIIKCTTGLSNI